MIIYIDADSCPVKDQARKIVEQFKGLEIYAVATTAHQMPNEFETIVCESEDQAVDLEILKRAKGKDIVVTQDYDLAQALLDRDVKVIHPNGWVYTHAGILARIANRSFSQLLRRHGYKKKKLTKKKKKDRKIKNRNRFEQSFKRLLIEGKKSENNSNK